MKPDQTYSPTGELCLVYPVTGRIVRAYPRGGKYELIIVPARFPKNQYRFGGTGVAYNRQIFKDRETMSSWVSKYLG